MCRAGNVNATDTIIDVLLLNGGTGDLQREVQVQEDDPLVLTMLRPPASPNGRFVVHANLASPTPASTGPLPADLGISCFQFLLPNGATPDAVWNNLGRTTRIGASTYFDGQPQDDPTAAPAVVLQLLEGDPVHLPPGTTVTFQAIVTDTATVSRRSASLTNAIVMHVQ